MHGKHVILDQLLLVNLGHERQLTQVVFVFHSLGRKADHSVDGQLA